MMLEVVYYTGRGKLRRENEDSLLIGKRVYNHEEMKEVRAEEREGGCYCVADGMGGYAGGAIASGVLAYSIGRNSGRDLERSIEEAEERMVEIGRESPELSNMGSVVTGVCIEKEIKVFNIGDSRTYLFRDGELTQLTRDDSLVWEIFGGREYSQAELHETLRNHPEKNIVTSAVGAGGRRKSMQIEDMPGEAGDRFLICSDGIWEELTYEDLLESIEIGGVEGGRKLLEKAMEEGRDNISFIIIEIKSK